MSLNFMKTYHVAPNFSIPAPDANGPLQLGTIIAGPRKSVPLNRTERVPIPAEQIYRSQAPELQFQMRTQTGGKLGIFAKVINLDGVGGRLSFRGGESNESNLLTDLVDTEFFHPSLEYIRRAIEVPSIRNFRNACRDRRPLFLITGIKVARGASMNAIQERTLGGGVEAGMPDLATGLVQIGANAGGEMIRGNEMSFRRASDFVLGYAVSRVTIKKGEVKAEPYERGAVLVSDDVHEVIYRDGGEIEVIDDFASESMDEDSVYVDDTFTADPGTCRWVLHHI